MELKRLKEKFKDSFKNYKYVLLILAVGIVLMALPTGSRSTQKEEENQNIIPEISQEEKLTQILKQIQGVGEVYVLLAAKSSGQITYQTDTDISNVSGGSDEKTETVILTDAQRNQTPLIKNSESPTYRGAVVVCQGGDLSAVKFAVTQAVINATGLSADRICVLKMK